MTYTLDVPTLAEEKFLVQVVRNVDRTSRWVTVKVTRQETSAIGTELTYATLGNITRVVRKATKR
jgi:hypothetical protein